MLPLANSIHFSSWCHLRFKLSLPQWKHPCISKWDKCPLWILQKAVPCMFLITALYIIIFDAEDPAWGLLHAKHIFYHWTTLPPLSQHFILYWLSQWQDYIRSSRMDCVIIIVVTPSLEESGRCIFEWMDEWMSKLHADVIGEVFQLTCRVWLPCSRFCISSCE